MCRPYCKECVVHCLSYPLEILGGLLCYLPIAASPTPLMWFLSAFTTMLHISICRISNIQLPTTKLFLVFICTKQDISPPWEIESSAICSPHLIRYLDPKHIFGHIGPKNLWSNILGLPLAIVCPKYVQGS